MSVLSDYDVNIFFHEFVDPVSGGPLFGENMVIAVSEYHSFNGVGYNTDTVYRFLLDSEETALIQAHCPESEFGTDWWECAEDFVNGPYCPPRVKTGLLNLPPVVKKEGE